MINLINIWKWIKIYWHLKSPVQTQSKNVKELEHKLGLSEQWCLDRQSLFNPYLSKLPCFSL